MSVQCAERYATQAWRQEPAALGDSTRARLLCLRETPPSFEEIDGVRMFGMSVHLWPALLPCATDVPFFLAASISNNT